MTTRAALVGGLRAVFAVGLLLSLAACGFHLRGQVQLPPQMARTYIGGAPSGDALVRALRSALRDNGVRVVSKERDATAVLQIESLKTSRSVLSVNADGTVADYQLVMQLAYSVRATQGNWHIPTQNLQTRRHYSYSDSQVLAKSSEAAQLRESMSRDLANLALLRLQAQARRKP
ncbi:MAG: LPS assembly lipoprotein LptE [Acidihalobacter sp.]